MRLLFLTPEIPHLYGGGQRMYYQIKYLSRPGVEIDLLSFRSGPGRAEDLPLRKSWLCDPPRPSRLANLLAMRAYRRDPEMERSLKVALFESKPDLIYAHKFEMASYLGRGEAARTVVDLWACGLSGAWSDVRHAPGLYGKLAALSRVPRYWLADEELYPRFRHFAVVSRQAKEWVDSRYPGKDVFVSPVGYEPPSGGQPSPASARVKNRIIFTGDMGFAPNEEAALRFITRIFPLVKKKVPGAVFRVAGRNPSARLLAAAAAVPGAEMAGAVKDMRAELDLAEVFAAPISGGAGMRTKLVEAFAAGLPVVATPRALEGLEAEPGVHALTAEEDAEFAERVAEVLKDPELSARLASAAAGLVGERYRWDMVADSLLAKLDEILRRHNYQG